MLEQGKVKDVAQLTAAIIVLGGTLGAVMVTTPMDLLRSAAGKFPAVFFETSHAPEAIIEQIIGLRHQGPQERHRLPGERNRRPSRTPFCARP